MAVVQCDKCGRTFNDYDRSWNCPHKRLFAGLSVAPDDVRPGRKSRAWVRALAYASILFVIGLAVALFLIVLRRSYPL